MLVIGTFRRAKGLLVRAKQTYFARNSTGHDWTTAKVSAIKAGGTRLGNETDIDGRRQFDGCYKPRGAVPENSRRAACGGCGVRQSGMLPPPPGFASLGCKLRILRRPRGGRRSAQA